MSILDNEHAKIVLPVFRKLTPFLIALDIVGVQPMTTDANYKLNIEDVFLEEFQSIAYGVDVQFNIFPNHELRNEIYNWVKDTFVIDNTVNVRVLVYNTKYYFKAEKDRTLFLLKWSI